MQRFTVSPAALEQQVAYLTSHGYHTIYFADLVAYFDQGRPLPDKPVILTFDDAWQEQYTLAYPILRKYGVVATFFPPINWIDHSRLTLTWAEIEEMDRHGMEFGSHTVNHHLLSKQTPAQIKAQLQDSKAALEKHVTKPVVALAYPGGDFNPTVIKLATQAGYGAAVWVVAGLYQDKAHRMVMPRMGLSYQTTLNALIAWLAAAGRDAPNIGPKVAPSPQANSSHQAWEERLLARKLNDMGDD